MVLKDAEASQFWGGWLSRHRFLTGEDREQPQLDVWMLAWAIR